MAAAPSAAERASAIHELWSRRFDLDAPRKIVCVGLNYRDHALEGGREAPVEPMFFAKFASALLDPGRPIVLPPEDDHFDSEAELAVVIGLGGRRIQREHALEHVAGYTAANDVSARTLQRKDKQWLRAKSFDTFCPLLPVLVPVAELGNASGLRITQQLNDVVLQDASTSDLIHDVPALVAHASAAFTLAPGDVILTGTPAGVGIFRDPPLSMRPGDRVRVVIEGIGALENPVAGERG
jgi:2-keto-4-pentenoate hydratase/2-oxohepta-3-ene-1,7-dioic acid hydratase in catechol pathway